MFIGVFKAKTESTSFLNIPEFSGSYYKINN